jgi:hypothetical protein
VQKGCRLVSGTIPGRVSSNTATGGNFEVCN